MVHNAKIKELMTTKVITVKPNDPMTVVSEIFRMNNIHHVPVVEEDNKVVGVISSQDYNKLLSTFTLFKTKRADEINEGLLRSMLAKDVMSKQLATLKPDDTILMAMGMFRENLFHGIPIVDDHKKIAGILTTYDLLNYAFSETTLIGDTNVPGSTKKNERIMEREEEEMENEEIE